MEKKVLTVLGPTASGKTGLALTLAKVFNGELISVDSRQVYKEMNIGTGKDLPAGAVFYPVPALNRFGDKFSVGYYLLNGTKVWLYDVISPDKILTATDFSALAEIVTKDILKRRKLPIFVGGTGFYFKALFSNFSIAGISPDWDLRKKLEKESLVALQNKLSEINPERFMAMNADDRKNPRRLIRAIEISLFKKNRSDPEERFLPAVSQISIGLTPTNDLLYSNISKRIDGMLKGGLVKEVSALSEKYGWDAPGLSAIGYRQFKSSLSNETSFSECEELVKSETRAYAKRQMTWFKKDKAINWFDPYVAGFDEKVIMLVKSKL